ncbi:uncharacterized protein [Porites lutea]|uniref:uncharacterized protein n=1 Tax=Porites lutea TaxID=51062 RepID=UPI003CC6C6E6
MVGIRLCDSDLQRLKQENPRLRCLLCEHLLREPVKIACGHTFCRSCVDTTSDLFSDCSSVVCPLDGEVFHRSQAFPDSSLREEIQFFVVQCLFVGNGCEWNGRVMHLEKHLTDFHSNQDSTLMQVPNLDDDVPIYPAFARIVSLSQQVLNREEQDPIQRALPLNVSQQAGPDAFGAAGQGNTVCAPQNRNRDHVREELWAETFRDLTVQLPGQSVMQEPETLKMEVRQLKEKIQDLERRLEEAVRKQDFETERQQQQVTERDLERQRFSREVVNLKTQMERLEQQVGAQRNLLQEFQYETKAERQRAYDDGMTETALNQACHNSLRNSHADLRNRYADLEARHADLQNSHAALQTSYADLQVRVKRLEDEIFSGP